MNVPGVTNPDPPDEIHNRESPCDRNVHAPNADAFDQQPTNGEVHHQQERERQRKAAEPAALHRSRENNVRDLFGDRRVVVTRRDDWLCDFRSHAMSSSGLELRNLREIGGSRPRVQFSKQTVIQWRGAHLRHAAVCIIDVAEHDCLGRTSLRACWRDLTIANGAIGFLRVNLHRVDPLNAVGAFLHHAAAAHGDVRIAHQLARGRLLELVGVVFQKIEPPHFVRAVIRAIARADAAVVNHLIEALTAVHGRGDGADQLAWRIFAMHARHRLMKAARFRAIAFEIAIDANPVHFASTRHLLFSDNRNVVLRLTGNGAGAATDAGVEINHHAPGVASVVDERVERFLIPRRRFLSLDDRARIFVKARQRSAAHLVAAFHLPVLLRGNEFVTLARSFNLQTCAAPHRV